MACKIVLGIALPVSGGWLHGTPIEEPEVSYSYVEKVAQAAENMGFDSVWVADHMLNPRKGEHVSVLEAWTTLTAIAMRTTRVKLGTAVMCQSFRYPAVLAKMASTLDEVSNGRLILSIGAGWFQREFQAYGTPQGKHDELIERAEEQIKIIRALWIRDTVDFDGKYYRLSRGVLVPKPVQKPCPPIWYGGDSEKSRQLVARVREVDGWLLRGGSSLEETKQKISDMKSRLEGRKLEYGMTAFTLVTQTEQEGEERVKKLASGKTFTVNWALKPGLVGPPAKIVERIHALEEVGIHHVILSFSSALNDLKVFSEQVMRYLR